MTCCLDQDLCLFRIYFFQRRAKLAGTGEGLLAEDVLAGIQRIFYITVMMRVRSCNIDDVDIGIFDQVWNVSQSVSWTRTIVIPVGLCVRDFELFDKLACFFD